MRGRLLFLLLIAAITGGIGYLTYRLVWSNSDQAQQEKTSSGTAKAKEIRPGFKMSNSVDKEKNVWKDGLNSGERAGTELKGEAEIRSNLELLTYLLEQGQDAEFLSKVDQIITAHPKVAEYAAIKADYYYLKQNWPAAEEAIKNLLELDPHNTFAQSSLGEVQGIQGKYDEGLQTLEKVLENEPGNLEALYSTISITDLQGDQSRGMQRVIELYQAHPQNGNLAMVYSDILMSQGRHEERREVLKKAMQSDSENPGPYRLAASDALRSENPKEAIRLAEESLKRDQNPETRLQAVDLMIRSADALGDLEKVKAYLEMKRELKPNDESIAAELRALQENSAQK